VLPAMSVRRKNQPTFALAFALDEDAGEGDEGGSSLGVPVGS
jgi:hypothetical protein